MRAQKIKGRFLSVGTGLVMLIIATLVSSTAMAKVYKVTVNDHNPKMAGPAQAVAHWAKKVEEKTNGQVKVNVHYGGVLLKGNEAYRGIQKGIADAAVYVLDRKDGFMLNSVVSLPFMGWPDQLSTAKIYMDLLENPEVRQEWKKVIPLVFNMMPPTHIHNTKKEIRLPSDLKGMKFHGSENALVQIMASAGATPIQMDIADMFMSVDRGLIDGVMNHYPVLIVFGVIKELPYHTIMGEGGINMTPMGIIWNTKKWKKIPKNVQLQIMSASADYQAMFRKMDAGMIAQGMAIAEQEGHKTAYLTEAEQKEWYNLVKEPVHDKWIAEGERRGLPTRKIYNQALELIEKYK